MKKIISKLLKIILPKEIYINRRDNNLFIFYANIELFFKTLTLRFTDYRFIFLPSRHISSIFLLDKLTNVLKKNKIPFFLWDACLLGAVRKQNAIAGSALDVDLGIIFNKKKHLKTLLSFNKEFKLKFHNKYNAVQLFHNLGTADISLFNKKNLYLEITVDIALGKEKNTYDPKNYKKKKIIYRLRDFTPFKKGKIYSKNFLIPKNSIGLIKKKYGLNWKLPDKKNQVYFN